MAVTLGTGSGLTDSELLANISNGDDISFELLFHRHYSRVYGLIFRIVGSSAEAEDIAQEVFLLLYRRPPARKGRDADHDHHVGAWLYRVATNSAYNAIRSRKRLWQRNTHLVPEEHDPASGPEKSLESVEEREKVRRALLTLKPWQAQLLLLRQMGLSYTELAESCQIAATSVGKQLSRAADSFRKAFEATE
ncbi:MAG: sigma-70 family RNA polymerase sigma factor [Chloroflexota bacterium]